MIDDWSCALGTVSNGKISLTTSPQTSGHSPDWKNLAYCVVCGWERDQKNFVQ